MICSQQTDQATSQVTVESDKHGKKKEVLAIVVAIMAITKIVVTGFLEDNIRKWLTGILAGQC